MELNEKKKFEAGKSKGNPFSMKKGDEDGKGKPNPFSMGKKKGDKKANPFAKKGDGEGNEEGGKGKKDKPDFFKKKDESLSLWQQWKVMREARENDTQTPQET